VIIEVKVFEMTNQIFGGNGIVAGLFDETVDTSKNVHARSFLEAAGKIAVDAFKAIADAPRKGVYASTLTYGIPEINDGYTTSTTLLGDYIASAPASQNWLKKVTGKHGSYVAGAAVLGGEDAGTYIDDTLIEGAKRYIVNYTDGNLEAAKKYAVHFVEAVKTDRHEKAHYELNILSENGAEGYAVSEFGKLAGRDPIVSFAYRTAA
jgi:hypothetical protein